jgi:hypothetical protein
MSEIEPFAEFLARTRAARPEEYAEAIRAGAAFSGREPEAVAAEFERMKQYILTYYEGVQPVGGFLSPSGQAIDCVPFDQQPTVRAARAAGYKVTPPHSPPNPPEQPPPAAARRQGHTGAAAAGQEAGPSGTHRCPEGTIPLLRITLDRLLRLGGLENFFRKHPGHLPPADADRPPSNSHGPL